MGIGAVFLKGGFISFLCNLSQSMLLKNGCYLSSIISIAPSLLVGSVTNSLFINCVARLEKVPPDNLGLFSNINEVILSMFLFSS